MKSEEIEIKERLSVLKEFDNNIYEYLMNKIEFNKLRRLKKMIKYIIKMCLVRLIRGYKNKMSIKGFISYINLYSNKKKILYITPVPTANLVRQSIHLRKTGEFETILLTENPWLGDFTEKYFDTVYIYDSNYTLVNILKDVKPYLIHILATIFNTEYFAILTKLLSKSPVITEFYDIASLMASKKDTYEIWNKQTVELGLFSEKFACEKCDGLIFGYSISAINILRNRYDIKAPILEFHSYICKEFINDNNKKHSDMDDKIHIVHGGMVIPSNLPGKNFGDTQYHHLVETITKQEIYFDIYLTPHYNFFKTKHLFSDYIFLAKTNPLFNFKRGLPLDKVPKEFSKYDFGAMISFLDRGGGLAEHIQTRLATKFFTYLEAGLPIIVSEEFQYPARLVKEYEIGIVVSQKDLDNLSKIIKSYDIEKLRANVKKAQKDLSMERHIGRLINFYQEVAGLNEGI